jgi:competence protein ComEC
VLVALPDGRHVLVDTGEAPRRSDCGAFCEQWHAHLLERLEADLHGAPIDMVWITHPHSDHVGGAPDVLARFRVRHYVDNGRDHQKAEIRRTHEAARAHGVSMGVVDPQHPEVPIRSTATTHIAAIVPREWPKACRDDANDCSILLRIDHCRSSVLFTGDAEAEEERAISVAPVTLLQVGHHGSATSTTEAFVRALAPRYAIISSGRPHEGPNDGYCHPRASTLRTLAPLLPSDGPPRPLRVYDARKCRSDDDSAWIDLPVSDHVWATSRDHDVVLSTRGDGVFTAERQGL